MFFYKDFWKQLGPGKFPLDEKTVQPGTAQIHPCPGFEHKLRRFGDGVKGRGLEAEGLKVRMTSIFC
jgi:hypothetical protein